MNVEITDLTRRFGRTQAVAGVSLQAGAGVFGLLGPNGAGKTSLLRMMATVIPPTSGRLRLLGPRSRRLRPAAGDPAAGSGTCRRTSATTRASRWRSSSSTSRC